MDLKLILQLAIALSVIGILSAITGFGMYFGLSWLLDNTPLRRVLKAIASVIGPLLKATAYGIGCALLGAILGLVSGLPVLAALCGAIGGVLGFSHGLAGKPSDLATTTKRSTSRGDGQSNRDYRRAAFSNQDVALFGLDQPRAPPPDIAPYAADDRMRRDDPWDAGLGVEWISAPLANPNQTGSTSPSGRGQPLVPNVEAGSDQ